MPEPIISEALTNWGVSQPVLRLIQQRLRDGSTPGRRKDRFKLGLVVEGGGMRGIVTGDYTASMVVKRLHGRVHAQVLMPVLTGAAHTHLAPVFPDAYDMAF